LGESPVPVAGAGEGLGLGAVPQEVRIEIRGKDDFWARAFHVEWEDQFPHRKLVPQESGNFVADIDWIGDLERVGEQCFCRIIRAPDNPERRRLFGLLVPRKPESR
jgi:hypothetical protein